MRKLLTTFLLTVLYASSVVSGYAQQHKEISFRTYVQHTENRSSVRFYYDEKLLDTVKVSYDDDDEILVAFKEVFKKMDYGVSIDSSTNRIFITTLPLISTYLPKKDVRAEEKVSANTLKSPLTPLRDKGRVVERNELVKLGTRQTNDINGNFFITGTIVNKADGKPINHARVLFENRFRDSIFTDKNGKFKAELLPGRTNVTIRSFGKGLFSCQLMVYDDATLIFELFDEMNLLDEVVINSERHNLERPQLGLEKLSIQRIKQIPTVFGEADVTRAILTLPGVQAVGEAANGFNVRGGATDQNLVLLDKATVFNPAHFFGFFSAFNPDVIEGAELYKSSLPVQYGGRLSSVLEVKEKTPNMEKFSGSGGVGPLTGRLSLEGPIGSKTSVLLSGRTTYSDWLLNLIPEDQYNNGSAQFYDANFMMRHELNNRFSVSASGYLSRDRFAFSGDTTYSYKNQHANLRLNSILSSSLTGDFVFGYDQYSFQVQGQEQANNRYQLEYKIGQAFLRGDFKWKNSENSSTSFGVNAILYHLNPGSLRPIGTESLVQPDEIQSEKALETALYVGNEWKVSENLFLDVGLRYVLFNNIGPQNINEYAEGLPVSTSNITGITSYQKGQVINTYHAPEFRLNIQQLLSETSSLKVGFNNSRQYIHMLSNTTAITPTDIWKLSDRYIRPLNGYQTSLGIYKNYNHHTIETSAELYYKKMHNLLDYKSGASLTMNHAIETDVIPTEGRAYGMELMLKKLTGRLNGWVSYTYSRIEQRTHAQNPADQINQGAYYPAGFDKPHDFTLVGNYRFSQRYGVSFNVTYSTGRPITLPLGRYEYGGSQRVLYSDRNSYRIPNYFRTDLSFNLEGSHKIKKLAHSSWSVGVYNLTGRENPFSVFYMAEGGQINGYQLSVFARPIPFINYNFKF
ncbi:TonB-dependent receptor [Olivibacter sp. SDN3]|uniref:TonB-dependent receptor n=1 Tax=Olivibacter sp. SDN3 TaxID=2764720 RepID=UPI00165187A5|nr:TonB-dependent receptor [Olivibacter sp. SDN3]QNL50836.1 TonB-dependent receptor [Olivibacter sp. SDN3]